MANTQKVSRSAARGSLHRLVRSLGKHNISPSMRVLARICATLALRGCVDQSTVLGRCRSEIVILRRAVGPVTIPLPGPQRSRGYVRGEQRPEVRCTRASHPALRQKAPLLSSIDRREAKSDLPSQRQLRRPLVVLRIPVAWLSLLSLTPTSKLRRGILPMLR